jgi:hypothetical protein
VPCIPWSGSGVSISYKECQDGEIPPDIYAKVWAGGGGGACGGGCAPTPGSGGGWGGAQARGCGHVLRAGGRKVREGGGG